MTLTPQATLDELSRRIEAEFDPGTRRPPIHRWNPPFCGDIDMEIRRNGDWYYQGGPIKRQALVRLFASVLRREDDRYVLVTPVEKVGIRVEDRPFHVATVHKLFREGQQFIRLTTTTDDVVVLSQQHPLVVTEQRGEPVPVVEIRDGLDGLLGRNAFYQLVEWGRERPGPEGSTELVVESAGLDFVLGRY